MSSSLKDLVPGLTYSPDAGSKPGEVVKAPEFDITQVATTNVVGRTESLGRSGRVLTRNDSAWIASPTTNGSDETAKQTLSVRGSIAFMRRSVSGKPDSSRLRWPKAFALGAHGSSGQASGAPDSGWRCRAP